VESGCLRHAVSLVAPHREVGSAKRDEETALRVKCDVSTLLHMRVLKRRHATCRLARVKEAQAPVTVAKKHSVRVAPRVCVQIRIQRLRSGVFSTLDGAHVAVLCGKIPRYTYMGIVRVYAVWTHALHRMSCASTTKA
jgi:hypothetical protein